MKYKIYKLKKLIRLEVPFFNKENLRDLCLSRNRMAKLQIN